MKRPSLQLLSLLANALLLFYLVHELKRSSVGPVAEPEPRTRSFASPYCGKFDQQERLHPSDLSAQLRSLDAEDEDEPVEWDVCRSKQISSSLPVPPTNVSASVPSFLPVHYCPFTPRVEQSFQLAFYGGTTTVKWPSFFPCALLPPGNYRWPKKQLLFPQPADSPPIFWSNLGLQRFNDVLAFNPGYPKNYVHFDTPSYDVAQEKSVSMAAKYIPFGKKVRTMLEIGGATGSLAFALNKRYDVTVINTVRPEFPYCEFISERGGVCLLLDSNRPMPFAKFSFDVIHHSWVFHGCRPAEWREVLLEQNRLLRPGGFLWITDGFSRPVRDTIRHLLVDQLGYRFLHQSERAQPAPPQVFFGPVPYEIDWTAILVKPNRLKNDGLNC